MVVFSEELSFPSSGTSLSQEGDRLSTCQSQVFFWLCSWINATAPFCAQVQLAGHMQKEKIWAKLHNPEHMRRLSNIFISFMLFTSFSASAFLNASIKLCIMISWIWLLFTVFPTVCFVSLLYGQLLTNTVLLIVIFPQIAVTNHCSEGMLSFAAADPLNYFH